MLIKIKNKNNNTKYPIRPGIVITENYSETLDSATLCIDHLTSKIEIEPLDEVIIYSTNSHFSNDLVTEDGVTYFVKYFCVDNFNCIQIAFGLPEYTYEISVVSQTKLLEGIILPSLKTTQLKTAYKRKIYTDNELLAEKYGYLDTYLDLYGKKYRTVSGTNFESKWNFSLSLKNRFKLIECPELQWNQPTLREVFTDLMMIDDCIPILRNNTINYLDLSVVGSEINTTNLTQVQESQSSAEYVSELRCELKNVTQTSVDGVNNTVLATEWIGFRNTDAYAITTKDFKLVLQNPIYELVSVKVSGPVYWLGVPGAGRHKFALYFNEYDLTPYIEEYKQWSTKPIYHHWWSGGRPAVEDYGKYQQNTLYYNRYGNTIENFDADIEGTHHTLYYTLELLLQKMIWDNINSFSGVTKGDVDYGEISDKEDGGKTDILNHLMFKVEYKTTATALFQAGKNKINNDKVVVDNQTNSYVDAYSQGLLEYMKANRLGNLMSVIEGRYLPTDTLPTIGQTYNGAVIFKTDTSYFDDYTLVNMYATPEYVLRDYFTGVQAKIRSWKIVSGNEALERHDLKKYYLEFDYTPANEIGPDAPRLRSLGLNTYFLNEFTTTTNKPIKWCGIRTIAIDNLGNFSYYPSNNTYYLADLSSKLVGNSLVFTFGFNDNYEAGRYIDNSVSPADLGGLAQLPYRYVDSNGEFYKIQYILTDNFVDNRRNELPNATQGAGGSDFDTWRTIAKDIQGMRPKALESEYQTILFSEEENLKKDNAEITRISTQFEFCSASDDLVFGTAFLKRLQAIRTGSIGTYLRLYGSAVKPTFRNKDNLPSDKSELINSESSSFAVTVNNGVLNLSFPTGWSSEYLYLTDYFNNVILAFKSNKTNTQNIYLNILQVRDKNRYDSDGYVVGSINQNKTVTIPSLREGISTVAYSYINQYGVSQIVNATNQTQTISVLYGTQITAVATSLNLFGYLVYPAGATTGTFSYIITSDITLPSIYSMYNTPDFTLTFTGGTLTINFGGLILINPVTIQVCDIDTFPSLVPTHPVYEQTNVISNATFTNLPMSLYYVRIKTEASGDVRESNWSAIKQTSVLITIPAKKEGIDSIVYSYTNGNNVASTINASASEQVIDCYPNSSISWVATVNSYYAQYSPLTGTATAIEGTEIPIIYAKFKVDTSITAVANPDPGTISIVGNLIPIGYQGPQPTRFVRARLKGTEDPEIFTATGSFVANITINNLLYGRTYNVYTKYIGTNDVKESDWFGPTELTSGA